VVSVPYALKEARMNALQSGLAKPTQEFASRTFVVLISQNPKKIVKLSTSTAQNTISVLN
jgi:hypothetical protein